MAIIAQWLDRFTHLRVDSARGNPAPHKPMLSNMVLYDWRDSDLTR